MRRWVRHLLTFLFIVLFVPAVIFLAGYAWLISGLPDLDGTIEVNGVAAPVEIVRDGRAIPHIFADSPEDAFYALGYVHAQDRLWQMEMSRRAGQGRVAEVAGRAGLGFDKLVRTLGFYRLAERIVGRLDADTRATLTAYADGVNGFLETRSGPLPLEFLAAGIEPEPWRPADSIVWGKLMTLQLSGNWFSERLRLQLARALSPAQIADLWPANAAVGPITLAADESLYRRVAALAGSGPAAVADHKRGFSNEWVVDGSRTESGLPLLANDPHLPYEAPNLWYLARIEAPGLSLTGATVPGVPAVLLGHNGRIAWGLTTTQSDVADLFIERLADGAPGRYLTPDGPVPFTTREEVIKVDGADDVTLTIRATRHGPVVSDLWRDQGLPLPAGHVLALQSAFLRDDDLSTQSLLRLNRATNWDEVLAALADHQAPQQNLVYADIAGNIGFIAPGLVPIRGRGDGFMPVPGWTGEYDWTGFIPFDELPRAFNPPSGRIVNANNIIVPPAYPHFLGREWGDPYRAARIGEMLDEAEPYDLNLFADIQADNLSGAARDVLPLLLAAPITGTRAAAAKARLAEWDYNMYRDRVAPLIFTAWLRELNRTLYADELGPLFGRYWGLRPDVVVNMLENRPAWCDDVTTPAPETCAARIALALDRATADLAATYGEDMNQWRWAYAHKATFNHRVFETVPLLDSVANISLAADGGAFTINRNASNIRDPDAPFAAIHGAGYRAIYDLSDLSKSLFIQATGQSGNPLSPHYDTFTERWRDFRYLSIAGDRDSLAESGLGVLTLVPGQ